jgi:hypothetical protein
MGSTTCNVCGRWPLGIWDERLSVVSVVPLAGRRIYRLLSSPPQLCLHFDGSGREPLASRSEPAKGC